MRTGAVDLIFANESELKSLYETSDFNAGIAALRNDVKLAVVTRSEKGCVVVSRESNEAVAAAPIDRLVDATGAGDLFAAGLPDRTCARARTTATARGSAPSRRRK